MRSGEVIRAAEMKDFLDDVGGAAEPWIVRAQLLVDQALINKATGFSLQCVVPVPGDLVSIVGATPVG